MQTLEVNVNSDTSVPSVAASRLEAWTQQINEAVRSSTGWGILTGQYFLEAKKELGHGQWTAMFEPGRLTIGLRMAEMLMRIASHPCLGNAKYFSNLPPGWSVLHELSKLPADVLEREIQTGAVHAELKLKEARAIVQRTQADAPQGKPAFNLQRQQTRLTNYLVEQAARWPADQQIRLADLLEEVARKLRTGGDKP